MISRTYGWVQNPSSFENLKKVVQIFDPSSEHYRRLKDSLVKDFIPFPELKKSLLTKLRSGQSTWSYSELVGSSRDINNKVAKSRSSAVANALIQVSIVAQTNKTRGKSWTDNWTADGFLRWALSLNLVQHDRQTDLCSITPLGQQYAAATSEAGKEISAEDLPILRKALLSYPPAVQVMRVLSQSEKPLTKFAIGERLGFKGEKGFTSYSDRLMKEWFANGSRKEQEKIKSDIEGTSDKYARMIAGWLAKIGYVSKQSVSVETETGRRSGFQEFTLTGAGHHAFRQANGSSKNTRLPKFLTWEFLAVDTSAKSRDYVRSRRAHLLKIIQSTESWKSIEKQLWSLGFDDAQQVLVNDLEGLRNIGLDLEFDTKRVKFNDTVVDFSIPNLVFNASQFKSDVQKKKELLINDTSLPQKYYALIELAYDGQQSRAFEILTLEFLTEVYGFSGALLGGGRKPDGVVFTSDFGIVVDTKAYKNGYSKSISQEDEMVRYIEDNQLRDPKRNATEWWLEFKEPIDEDRFYYLWVSSFFKARFPEQLKSTSFRTKTDGGALNVENLLIGGDLIQRGILRLEDLEASLHNEEINWTPNQELLFATPVRERL